MPAGWQAGDRTGVKALMQSVAEHAVPHESRTDSTAAVIPVTRCADDSLGGTLREAIAAAGEHDTIDLSALSCSTITLSQGAIPIMADYLTIRGPGSGRLAIDGAGLDRVFVDYGIDTLRLDSLTVRNGVNAVAGFHVAGGGCVIANAYVILDHSTLSGCTATGEGAYGGGILASGVVLYSSTLTGNVALGANPSTFTAAYAGGAFAYRGMATLYDSSVSRNRAAHDPTDTLGSYCTGGGIFSDNGGYAYRSTFSANYSYGTGGGLASHSGFYVSQSTVSGNTAELKAGGGLFVRLFGSMGIYNSTIAGNRALRGGGIYLSGRPTGVRLESTLIATNAAQSDVARDIDAQAVMLIAGSHNLVLSASNVTLPGDTLSTNPALQPLTDNGGPTRTRALSPGSPALDAGSNPLNFVDDQRGSGFPRVVGNAPDIGAFEGSKALPPPATVSAISQWLAVVLAGLLALSGGRRRTRMQS